MGRDENSRDRYTFLGLRDAAVLNIATASIRRPAACEHAIAELALTQYRFGGCGQ